MLRPLSRPPDKARPTGTWALDSADTAADCRTDRNAKADAPQWMRHTSVRLVAIVGAYRQAFPVVALPRNIQMAIAREWGRS